MENIAMAARGDFDRCRLCRVLETTSDVIQQQLLAWLRRWNVWLGEALGFQKQSSP